MRPRTAIVIVGYGNVGRGVRHAIARHVKGVKDARQYTIPIPKARERVRSGENPSLCQREKHRRLVYVVAEDGADEDRIVREIKGMPNYYSDYDTEVVFVTDAEMKRDYAAYPHAGFVLASGATGGGNKALIEYRILDLPAAYLSPHPADELRRKYL
jgi:diaminopimelate dehydrogenase